MDHASVYLINIDLLINLWDSSRTCGQLKNELDVFHDLKKLINSYGQNRFVSRVTIRV